MSGTHPVLTASGRKGLKLVFDSLSLHGNSGWTAVRPAPSERRCAADELLTDLIYLFESCLFLRQGLWIFKNQEICIYIYIYIYIYICIYI